MARRQALMICADEVYSTLLDDFDIRAFGLISLRFRSRRRLLLI